MLEIKLEKMELPFAMAEEIKNLRSSIRFSGENIKSLLFTSSTPNEGKSTIALETVRAFADLGKKALYIDCDLRKSILKVKITKGSIRSGLTHYLTGQCGLEDIIYRNVAKDDDVEFDIIPAGPLSSSPTELIASGKFEEMLKKLRDEYDVIIIDSPPLASVGDAAIIGSFVDGSILVVEAGSVDYRLIQKTRDKLFASGSRILGVVLNKVDNSKKKYGYYKHGYGYGYGYSNRYGSQDSYRN
ncbi:CpsD/CapB family tyrosine-protein kinase [Butyrivibrio sp. VCB2006]|uniref:CpsD/CapB family tyrosine-protein kinase n=1 Tax=Butyrivibrio sp. VCB2006 TaxID=1280679 RepID=UPI000403F4A6|nr:CpsD/CapB family tyrosine-protein kinase [Butyrivibrio sp. VCB2006]